MYMQGSEFTFYNFSYFQVTIWFRLAVRATDDEYNMPLLGTCKGMNLPSTTFHTFKFLFHFVSRSALALTNYLTYENNMLRARADDLHQEKDVENIVKHKVWILEQSFSEKNGESYYQYFIMVIIFRSKIVRTVDYY